MWNGLWKLTVMVGVIGVGLFAAYKAQQGMNHSSTVAKSDPGADEAEPDSTSSATDGKTSKNSPLDDPGEIFAKSGPEPRIRNTPNAKPKSTEPQIDLLGNFTDDQSPVQAANRKNKSSPSVITVKQTRRPGVDFRDDEPFANDTQSDASSAPKQLPEEPSTDVKTSKSSRSIQQVNARSNDEENAPAFDESNPFDTETSTTTHTKTDPFKLDEPHKVETPKEEFAEEPGRAQVSTAITPDSGPPKSARARKNAMKRVEPSTENESNPFDSDSPPTTNPTSSPPRGLSAPRTSVNDTEPELGAPERFDGFPNRDRSNPTPEQRPVPVDSLSNSNDDNGLLRSSSPNRRRPSMPATLPSDLDFPGDPSPGSREPSTRRADYDRVMPIDMVGDGLAGEVSQRGLQQPRLTIEKVAQQQAVLDQPLVYTIIVKNAGTVDAHNIVIEDRIPKGTELQGTSPQAELSGKLLSWKHLVLKPNEEKRISIKVIPKQEGPIGSVARVYFATEVTAEIVVTAPQLEFTVKAPSEVRVGQRFDLIFNLRNIGKVDASNIIVRDLVPDQLKHDSGSDIECPIGKMAPQDVKEIVLPVIAMKTGSVINKAILTADSGVKKTLDSTIDIVGEVLVLTRTGQDRLYVERPAVFTNTIRNDGNQRADRVKIAEVVPAGMEFETASDGGKYDANLRAVVWTVGPLSPGNDKSVTVKYVPKQTGTHAAKITATGNNGSNAAVNGTVEVIGKPELQMETLTATGAVTVGDRITSRFQLNNTGTAPASNVQLRVKLPRELRLISVKGSNYQQKDNEILFETIDELGPRKKAAYELVLEPIAEADAQIGLEIWADHLRKPGQRVETIQIARDALK